ncbi:hypothetical protein F4779DRAFT_559831 [Xylariaceae sp. FL0662B]|nr:hypothetical protein F4779DRAFT_559831 [Xylariaceae sp. FL0662B]
MDGPTSRLPSTSIASIVSTNPDLAHAVTARRSVKETFSSAPVTPNAYYIDPPRPAKEGHEWVWFPGGYWAEREVVETPSRAIKAFKWRKRSGKNSSDKETQDSRAQSPRNLPDQQSTSPELLASPYLTEEAHVRSLQRSPTYRHGTSSESGSSFPLNRLPQAPMPSPYLTEETHVQSLQRPSLYGQSSGSRSRSSLSKHTKPPTSSPLTLAGEVLGSVTPFASSPGILVTPPLSLPRVAQDSKPKKSFIARLLPEPRPPKPKKTHSNDADYTTNTLAGARTQLSLNHTTSLNRMTSLLREESRKPQKSWSLKLFGKSPWHHKESASSEASASSSLCDVLRGRTPVTSPASGKSVYFDTESSSSPYSTNYPGGEATRVKTPPLRERGHAGRPRSFFFDISVPTPPSPPPSPSRDGHDNSGHRDFEILTPSPSPSPKMRKPNREPSCKEWWEVPAAIPRYTDMAPAAFEFDIPEHLPNSPMCPANKKHKSGGTGVCVYHGRGKRSCNGSVAADKSDEGGEDVWT